jgi:solute:Na+ symporter, SSS family
MTGLMASFMSGMAGNVTAFNTVFHLRYLPELHPPRRTRSHHYLTVGRVTTVVGVLLSIAAAYVATRYNNIMDLLQLGLRLRECAAVRHLPARHVLEAHHRHGAFAGLTLGTLAAVLTLSHHHGRRQRRLDRQSVSFPIADGAELLDRDHRVYHLLRHLRSRSAW